MTCLEECFLLFLNPFQVLHKYQTISINLSSSITCYKTSPWLQPLTFFFSFLQNRMRLPLRCQLMALPNWGELLRKIATFLHFSTLFLFLHHPIPLLAHDKKLISRRSRVRLESTWERNFLCSFYYLTDKQTALFIIVSRSTHVTFTRLHIWNHSAHSGCAWRLNQIPSSHWCIISHFTASEMLPYRPNTEPGSFPSQLDVYTN